MEIRKMKKTKKCANLPKPLPESAVFCQNALFLDIETTGFSPEKNQLYLIGAAWFDRQESKDTDASGGLHKTASSFTRQTEDGVACSIIIQQFFAETPEEEPILLSCLEHLLSRFDTLITFNGTLFDLPFIKNCAARLGLDFYFSYDPETHADLYRLAWSYRHIFRLDSYKQKALELFAGIGREDPYSGRELVKLYKTYQKHPDEQLLHLLLQHNYEDVLGMAGLVCLYAYDAFFKGGFIPVECRQQPCRNLDGTEGLELLITCRLNEPLAAAISCHNSSCYLHARKNLAFLRIPFFQGVLKHFYPDYKNYYYLPQEDTAIHKSIASFVDKSCRQKAKAASCYTKKEGIFLPQYEETAGPVFYKEYKDSVSYFEWEHAYAGDEMFLKRYCMHMLEVLKSGKH